MHIYASVRILCNDIFIKGLHDVGFTILHKYIFKKLCNLNSTQSALRSLTCWKQLLNQSLATISNRGYAVDIGCAGITTATLYWRAPKDKNSCLQSLMMARHWSGDFHFSQLNWAMQAELNLDYIIFWRYIYAMWYVFVHVYAEIVYSETFSFI